MRNGLFCIGLLNPPLKLGRQKALIALSSTGC